MRALTLQRPWDWCIYALPARERKDVENRSWIPPDWIIGERIAIHSGLYYNAEAADMLRGEDVSVPPRNELPAGAITCTAVVLGWIHESGSSSKSLKPTAAARALESEWWGGEGYGWVIGDVKRLSVPVPCKGALKLWHLPQKVEQEVLRLDRLAKAS
jgi:hypothetical protein